MITQKTRYALRSLLFLVEVGRGDPVQLQEIAETQRIPRKYLELIMLDLKKAGIVTSIRGPKGGYRLTRSPEASNRPHRLVAGPPGRDWSRFDAGQYQSLTGARLSFH